MWGSTQEWQDPATVTEHVRRLRLKLEPDAANPRWLHTVRGIGYRFSVESAGWIEAAPRCSETLPTPGQIEDGILDLGHGSPQLVVDDALNDPVAFIPEVGAIGSAHGDEARGIEGSLETVPSHLERIEARVPLNFFHGAEDVIEVLGHSDPNSASKRSSNGSWPHNTI